MIMSSTCIKVNINFAITDGLNKLVLVKSGKLKDVIIKEVFLPTLSRSFAFDIGSNIEAVFEFCSSLVKKVVKPPIRNYIKIAEMTCTLFDAFRPCLMALIGMSIFKDDFNLAFLVVDIHFEATVSKRTGIKGCTK